MSEQTSSKLISYAVFLATLGVLGISIVSVIFPALIISSTYEFSTDLEPFESNSWLPLIVFSTLSLLIIGFLFKNKKLPSPFFTAIQFILNFEISKKITIITAIIILVTYAGFSFNELFLDEKEQWPDYYILEESLEIWPSTDHWSVYIKEQNTRYVRMMLLEFSQDFLQNIKFLPFAGSILTVVFTGLITTQIAKKRFAGVISMLILLQSTTFTDFDTIAVYENFWVLFYLISLYLIQKRWWYGSSVSFLLSIFTKAFIVTYSWMHIFFIYRAEIPRKTKYALLGTYGVVFGLVYLIFESGRSIIYDDIVRFDSAAFFDGFTGWGNNMQLEPLAILGILPLVVGLFIKSMRGVKQADSILILIMGTILAAPLISFVTDFYFILPYRYIPFIVAMAIGIGVFLSKEN
tara:strand:+ start:1977 stop:3197 length:1221 start_codon:yes stop_codon:yes gene_type:complete